MGIKARSLERDLSSTYSEIRNNIRIHSTMKLSILFSLVIFAVVMYISGVASQADDPCFNTHHDQASCNADDSTGGGCIWCKCSALPSACFTTANAESLPSSIYDCKK